MTKPTNVTKIDGNAVAAEIFTEMEAPFPVPVTLSLVRGSNDIIIEFDPPLEFCLALDDDHGVDEAEFTSEMLTPDIIGKLRMGSTFDARLNGRLTTLRKVLRSDFAEAVNWRDVVGRDKLAG